MQAVGLVEHLPGAHRLHAERSGAMSSPSQGPALSSQCGSAQVMKHFSKIWRLALLLQEIETIAVLAQLGFEEEAWSISIPYGSFLRKREAETSWRPLW